MNRPRGIYRLAVTAALVCAISATVSAAPIDTPTIVDSQPPPKTENPNADPPPVVQDESVGHALQELENLEELQQAKAALIAGDIELCREHLRAAYARHPNLPPPEMMLARLYLSSGQIAAGRRLLEEVSIADPSHPELYLLFGKLALTEGRVTDAILQFEKASALDLPKDWTDAQRSYFQRECAVARTTIAELRRDWDAAAELYQQQVKANPQAAKLRDRFAMALFRNGQLKQAFEQFDIAHRQDPKIARPEVSMAVMHVQGQDYAKADQWLQKALAKYPDDAGVHFQCSIALMYEDRAEEAERHAAKAAELGLDSDALLSHRGLIAMQLGEHERAEEFYQQALERTQSIDAKTSLALALAEQDDPAKRKQAMEVIQSAAKQQPNYPMVKTVLGWVQFRNGQLDDAEATLREAAGRLPSERTTLLFLSRVLMEQKHEDQARQVAERLRRVIDQPGIVAFRPEARKWLDQVQGERE